MGDRTYVNLQVHPDDVTKPEYQEWLEEFGRGETSDGPGHEFYGEVNDAGYNDLERLAKAGIRFAGDHGAGGCYNAQDFFHDGDGIVIYSPIDLWPGYVVVPVRNGKVLDEEARIATSVLERYKALWKSIQVGIQNEESISS